MRHVQLKGGKLISDFDLYALLIKGDKSGDVQLKSGDVLYFPAHWKPDSSPRQRANPCYL